MKNPKASHCSDECLLSEIKSSEPVKMEEKGAESWKEESNPWN